MINQDIAQDISIPLVRKREELYSIFIIYFYYISFHSRVFERYILEKKDITGLSTVNLSKEYTLLSNYRFETERRGRDRCLHGVAPWGGERGWGGAAALPRPAWAADLYSAGRQNNDPRDSRRRWRADVDFDSKET